MIRLLLILGAMLGAFAIWGLRSDGGARMFDEMAGIIPFGAGLLGVTLMIVALALWAWRFLRARWRE